MKILYTAEATATGGREGHAVSSDGNLDVSLVTPKEMGGPGGVGTNPEQLFAAGYAACFENALMAVARRQKMPLDTAAMTVTARVGIGPIEGGAFGLDIELHIKLPGLQRPEAEALVEAGHKVCPYSNATRGNIDVRLVIEEPTV
ncbi:MAG: organic hydroperoxide resistance protein [Chloroflexota bacterium]|nr:organic hydroperoxide resistance protein [Chloroflexota bacterium]